MCKVEHSEKSTSSSTQNKKVSVIQNPRLYNQISLFKFKCSSKLCKADTIIGKFNSR